VCVLAGDINEGSGATHLTGGCLMLFADIHGTNRCVSDTNIFPMAGR
jgi:hypothetical protein